MKALNKITQGIKNIKEDYKIFKNGKTYHYAKAITDIAIATPLVPVVAPAMIFKGAFKTIFKSDYEKEQEQKAIQKARREVFNDLIDSISNGFLEFLYMLSMVSYNVGKLAFKPKEEQRHLMSGGKIYETEEEKEVVKKSVKVKARAKRINKIRKNNEFQKSLQEKQSPKTLPEVKPSIQPEIAVKRKEVKKVVKDSKPEIKIGVNTDNVTNNTSLINRYLVKCDKFIKSNTNGLNEKDKKSINYLKDRLIDLNAHIETYMEYSEENENLIKVVKYISKCTTGKDFVRISKNKKLYNNIDFLKIEFNKLVIRDIRKQELNKLKERNEAYNEKRFKNLTETRTLEELPVNLPKYKVINLEEEKAPDYKELYEKEVVKNIKSNKRKQKRDLRPGQEKLVRK